MTDKSNRPCIILVSSAPWVYHWVKFYGLDVFRIEDQLTTDPSNASSPMNTIKIDYKRSAEIFPILESLCRQKEVLACYTSVEQASGFAHLVSKKFNLPYQSCSNFNHINNKLFMREIINSKIDDVVPAKMVEDDMTVFDFFQEYGMSIIKPIKGYGSRSISLVNQTNVHQFGDLPAGEYVIEKFVEGEEFSVEAFSYNGVHKLVGITKKIVDPETFSEKGHLFPANLEPKLEEHIWQTVQNYLTWLELENGPSHTEIKVNDQKIFLIETHNRPGADHIPQLVELTTGFNTYKTAIGWCAKKVSPNDHKVKSTGFAASYFIFSDKPGRLKSFVNTDVIRWMKGVKDVVGYHSIGDSVQKTTNSFNRLGHIIVYGDSHEACMQSIRNVEQYLDIVID